MVVVLCRRCRGKVLEFALFAEGDAGNESRCAGSWRSSVEVSVSARVVSRTHLSQCIQAFIALLKRLSML